jgi:hypothetical protein
LSLCASAAGKASRSHSKSYRNGVAATGPAADARAALSGKAAGYEALPNALISGSGQTPQKHTASDPCN